MSPEGAAAVLGALLVTAAASGAAAGVVAACFIGLVEAGTNLVWSTVPAAAGVQPFDSWWLFAVPILGGVLVGLGRRFLGAHPEPLERILAEWRAGRPVSPKTIPATVLNSLAALITGGPVGFEAALAGLVGGLAAWVGNRVSSLGLLIRQAWGAARVDALPKSTTSLPYWLAAVAGLLAYRALPFGQLDFGFRFDSFSGQLGLGDVAVVFLFAAVISVPVAWAAAAVVRAEGAAVANRFPLPAAVIGGLLFATLALGSEFVLFSGQEGIQRLVGLSTGTLLYLGRREMAGPGHRADDRLARWADLPLFFSAAALAIAVQPLLGVAPDVLVMAGVSAVSVVFLRGNVPAAFLLSLYVAPFSYTGIILIAALGAATAFAVAGNLRIVPARTVPASP